jgi:hypothetical protein
MNEQGDIFFCLRGEMETSRDLAGRLRECAGSDSIPVEEDDSKFGGICLSLLCFVFQRANIMFQVCGMWKRLFQANGLPNY